MTLKSFSRPCETNAVVHGIFRPGLTVLVITSLAFSARADITTGLVAYWSLADGPGNSNVVDLAGNGNTGTLTNFSDPTYDSMWTTNSDPTNGWPYALSFNAGGATTNSVFVPDSTSLDTIPTTKAFTLAAWVKLSAPSSSGVILVKGASGAESWCMGLNSSQFQVFMRNSSGNSKQTATGGGTASVGTWYHVVGTYKPAGTPHVVLYINGFDVADSGSATLTTIHATSVAATIGNYPDASAPFPGTIDEVRIYNQTLAASDVLQLYEHDANALPVNSGIGYWNGVAGSGGNANLDTTSLNFCTNAYAAPLGTASSLANLLTVEQAASMPPSCFFADAFYTNTIAAGVLATNLNIAPGGVAIGTARGPGTNFFLNDALTYSLNSTDNNGLKDGANPTVLVQSGFGTTVLTGTNTFTGGAVVNAGVLMIGNGSVPAGSVLNPGCPVTLNNGTIEFNGNDSPTVTNVISGSGTLEWAGAGTLTLGTNNTYTGATVLPSGTLSASVIADTGASSMGSNVLTLAGGTLAYTGAGATTTAREVTGVKGTTSTIDVAGGASLELSGRVTAVSSGAWTINKTDAGTLILSGTGDNSYLGMNINGGTVIFNKASSVTPSVHAVGEATTVGDGGTLQLSGTGGAQIYNASDTPVTINSGGVLDLNGQNNSLSTLNLSGAGNTNDDFGGALINSASNTISTLNSPITLEADTAMGGSGIISLPGVIGGLGVSLSYVGSGTLQLSSANAYTGSTTVSNISGTLDAQVSGSLPGDVIVSAGTLEMDDPAAMASTADLSVASGASVNLTYGGTQSINALFVNGVQQASGVYGAGAYNPSGVFSSIGTLTVSSGPPITLAPPVINASQQIVISWSSVPGGTYNVLTTTNLSPPITWTVVNSSPIPATGTNTTYTLPGSILGQPQLFVTVQQ